MSQKPQYQLAAESVLEDCEPGKPSDYRLSQPDVELQKTREKIGHKKAEKKVRVCLKCRREFESLDNRLCRPCRRTNARFNYHPEKTIMRGWKT